MALRHGRFHFGKGSHLRAPVDLLRSDVREVSMLLARRIWWRLPAAIRHLPPLQWYGLHLHAMVQRFVDRTQNHSTFFFRNRPELELMKRLVDQAAHGSRVAISVLACSKGAEVYSIAWTIRSARPDLKLTVHAVDIAQDILNFAKEGVYSLSGVEPRSAEDTYGRNTHRDQVVSIFERMTPHEMEAIFDREGGLLKVKPWLKEGISWHCRDVEALDPLVLSGPQDIVVANRFLCHM